MPGSQLFGRKIQICCIMRILHKRLFHYSMVPIKRTVFFNTVTVLKRTVLLTLTGPEGPPSIDQML